jgi:hypothetical protein
MMHGNMRTYANGRKKKYNAWSTKKKTYVGGDSAIPNYSAPPPRRGAMQSASIQSVGVVGEVCTTKVESKKYTGTLVKGISTMHKSNAVPIIDESEAKEHANMRR